MRWGDFYCITPLEKLKKSSRKIFSEPLLYYVKGTVAYTKTKSLGFAYIQVMGIRSMTSFEHS